VASIPRFQGRTATGAHARRRAQTVIDALKVMLAGDEPAAATSEATDSETVDLTIAS